MEPLIERCAPGADGAFIGSAGARGGARGGTADGEIERLASAAQVGAPRAFDELVRRLRPRITGFAIRVLGDRSLAEDAAQETFVRLFRFLPRYRPVPGRRDGFTAWCFQIAHNACLDVAGRERRAARALEAPPRAPADPIERADVRRAIEEALARLPEPLLRTFLLRQQGLTYEDVAKVLAVPVGTVRSRLHEARMRLREMLSRSLEEYREGGDR